MTDLQPDGSVVPVTFFHLPDERPYDPIRNPSGGVGHDIRAAGFVPTHNGMEVTIHGYGRYRVSGSSFHIGQPDELPGLHVFLEEVEAI